ncbi:DUF6030 family protein [Rhizobium pusense]|uniref:DUF6030 family protein n=3 Tax=Agrobacterium pusense TaxID=648995 RepID=UPI00244C462C|nr:DUF6030 family protein [Agrobacterium pusense]MDH1098405.1 DUF6030 family protein [Agrobacterium pusense]MDH1114515.1 DUF6030 family protein [Agrobacterium pusense]MDH2195721.1 DUF6030 family protein [Agrobacterium pusense]
MDAGPEKEVSHCALLFAVLVVCFAILATVLLANDKKHLKSLLIHFNLVSVTRFAEAPPKKETVKRQELADATISLPPHLLKFEQTGDRTPFARDFVVSGRDLCDRLTTEVFVNPQDWHASPVDIHRFECMADITEGNPADPAGRASLFLEIRGKASGKIKSIRMKAVAPPTPDGVIISARLDAALAIIIEQTRWADLVAMREPARRMQAYQAQHFGISVSIKPEQTAPHRLNVILLANDQTPELKLTHGFVNRRR